VLLASFEENSKLGVLSLIVLEGPSVMVVFGFVLSTFTVTELDEPASLPAASVAFAV
jgi:hypothetical protein